MTTSYYSTGTVTLTNGSATVTGTGTAWQTALITGGNIFVQAPGNVLPIATVNSETQITAELQWTGTTGTYAYRIQRDTAYLKTLDTNSGALSSYLAQLAKPSIAALSSLSPAANKIPYFTGPTGAGLLDTSAFYAPGSIIGTVSQTGGTPTGAIIEQGSNSNGRYVKYADGTMICWYTSSTLNTASTAFGSLFIGSLVTLTFPVAFAAAPAVVPSAARSASTTGAVWVYLANVAQSATQTSFNILSATTGGTAYPAYIAIGRWF